MANGVGREREEQRKGEVFKIVVEQMRHRTRSWRIINERDSQDFTGAEVVFVKRFHYHHRRQRRMVEICALLAPRRVGHRSMPLRRRSSDLPLTLYRRSAR